jgi:hypothetical protein
MVDLGFGYEVGVKMAEEISIEKIRDCIAEHPELSDLEEALLRAAKKKAKKHYKRAYDSSALL